MGLNQGLNEGVGVNTGVNDKNAPSPLAGEGWGEGLNPASQQTQTTEENAQPENQLSNDLTQQNLPQQLDAEAILNLLKLVYQYAKENGDTETLNNLDKVYVVTAKMNSEITKDIVNNPYFQDELKNKLDDMSKGKYKDSSFSIDFPNSGHKIVADSNKDFSTHNTIGKCDVHNVELGQDGYIHATIIDYYNFDKHNMTPRARNAYLQQQNGRLNNYALMIPIRVKLKK